MLMGSRRGTDERPVGMEMLIGVETIKTLMVKLGHLSFLLRGPAMV